MDIKTKRSWLKVVSLVNLIMGILLCVMIMGLPFGIPAIIASNRFKAMYKTEDDGMLAKQIEEKENFGWMVYSILVCTVIGILGLVFVYSQETKNIDKG